MKLNLKMSVGEFSETDYNKNDVTIGHANIVEKVIKLKDEELGKGNYKFRDKIKKSKTMNY